MAKFWISAVHKTEIPRNQNNIVNLQSILVWNKIIFTINSRDKRF